jgi:actin-related protein
MLRHPHNRRRYCQCIHSNIMPPSYCSLSAGCGLVVDAGFSFTHAVPVFDWRMLGAGMRRIDLGGKALTNFMKELVSYRHAQLSAYKSRCGHPICYCHSRPATPL